MPAHDLTPEQKEEQMTYWTSREWVVPIEVRCLTSADSAEVFFVKFRVRSVMFPALGKLLVEGYVSGFPFDKWDGIHVNRVNHTTMSIAPLHFYKDAAAASVGYDAALQAAAGNSSVVAAFLPCFKLRGTVLSRIHDLEDLPDVVQQVWCSKTLTSVREAV